ncbi:MAG TPA: hypothetical protein VI643_06620, partial [Planctomycetota bacterium]|nr:hypothetical protein [Planctomycetota bacterium]
SISDGLPNGLMLDRAADETRSGRARAGEPSETASTWIAVNALSRAVESARFTSAQEEEADRHVIRVLVESNHNPSALTAILLRILRKEVDSGRYGDLHRVTEARAGGIARHISEHYASAMGRQYETRRFDAGTRRAEQIRKAFTWVEHAEVSLARGDTARALKYLDDAVALRPSDPFLLLARGRARFAANQPAEAEIDFNAAISRTHGIESLFVGRARARHALGSYATAADDLREAVDLARRPESFLLLGECEERQARYNAARAALVNCITLAGFDPSTVPPSHAPAAAREAYDRLQIVLRRLR